MSNPLIYASVRFDDYETTSDYYLCAFDLDWNLVSISDEIMSIIHNDTEYKGGLRLPWPTQKDEIIGFVRQHGVRYDPVSLDQIIQSSSILTGVTYRGDICDGGDYIYFAEEENEHRVFRMDYYTLNSFIQSPLFPERVRAVCIDENNVFAGCLYPWGETDPYVCLVKMGVDLASFLETYEIADTPGVWDRAMVEKGDYIYVGYGTATTGRVVKHNKSDLSVGGELEIIAGPMFMKIDDYDGYLHVVAGESATDEGRYYKIDTSGEMSIDQNVLLWDDTDTAKRQNNVGIRDGFLYLILANKDLCKYRIDPFEEITRKSYTDQNIDYILGGNLVIEDFVKVPTPILSAEQINNQIKLSWTYPEV